MRNVATLLAIAATATILTLPLAQAQDRNDPATPPPSKPAHVQQHQEAIPPSSPQDSKARRDQSARDQAAQAPQSPAVITPPATGDKSVITPPANGEAKTPVIKPPGTPGNNDDIQAK